MDTKARVLSFHKDYRTKKFQMVLEVDYLNPDEDFTGEKRLTLKQWREKRSLDANGYLWHLMEQVAIQLDSTKEEIYEDFIRRYGFLDHDENGYITVTMRADIDPSHLPGHWKLDNARSTYEWKVYRRIRGTSEYDTKEMSFFLDRVIEDAKQLGVDTITKDELERLKGYGR